MLTLLFYRLARNRASAKIRRIKEKSVADNCEQETKSLEYILGQLKGHEYGVDGANPLKDCLGEEKEEEEEEET